MVFDLDKGLFVHNYTLLDELIQQEIWLWPWFLDWSIDLKNVCLVSHVFSKHGRTESIDGSLVNLPTFLRSWTKTVSGNGQRTWDIVKWEITNYLGRRCFGKLDPDPMLLWCQIWSGSPIAVLPSDCLSVSGRHNGYWLPGSLFSGAHWRDTTDCGILLCIHVQYSTVIDGNTRRDIPQNALQINAAG